MEEYFLGEAGPTASEERLALEGLNQSPIHHDNKVTEEFKPKRAPQIPESCMHKDPERRKFRLTFETVSSELMDDCRNHSRSKCLSFWNFIDADPTLRGLVKEGQFIHKNEPKKVQTKAIKNEYDTFKSRFGMTKEEFLASRNGGLQRLKNRRELNAALEEKSGQLPFSRNHLKPKVHLKPKEQLADAAFKESEEDTIQDMNDYDNQKST